MTNISDKLATILCREKIPRWGEYTFCAQYFGLEKGISNIGVVMKKQKKEDNLYDCSYGSNGEIRINGNVLLTKLGHETFKDEDIISVKADFNK